jgi:HEAT repeat protein
MTRHTQPDPLPLPQVLHQLASPSPTLRRQAVIELAGWHHREQIGQHLPRLLPLLTSDPSTLVRQTTAEVLARFSSGRNLTEYPELHEALRTSLQDRNGRVRFFAACALWREKAAIDVLLPLLKDRNWRLRSDAMRQLARLSDPRVVPALLARLHHPDTSVQYDVLVNLRQMADTQQHATIADTLLHYLLKFQQLPGDVDYQQDPLYDCLAETLAVVATPETRRHLVDLLRDASLHPVIHWVVVAAFTKAPQPDVVEPLLALLTSQEVTSQARHFAAHLCRSHKDARAVEPLLTLLHDQDANVRGSAALALGALGDRRAVEPLLPLLADPSPYQEVYVYYRPALQRVPSVQLAAARALGQLGDPHATRPLWAAFGAAPELSPEVLIALGRLGDARVLAPLGALLCDPERTYPGFQEALFNEHLIPPLIEALTRLGPAGGEDILIQVMNDTTWKHGSREACADALLSLGTKGAVAAVQAAVFSNRLRPTVSLWVKLQQWTRT